MSEEERLDPNDTRLSLYDDGWERSAYPPDPCLYANWIHDGEEYTARIWPKHWPPPEVMQVTIWRKPEVVDTQVSTLEAAKELVYEFRVRQGSNNPYRGPRARREGFKPTPASLDEDGSSGPTNDSL